MTVTPAVNTKSWTGTEPVAVCEEQVRFSTLTHLEADSLQNFSLTLTNEFAPDDQLFQNSATRSADTCISTSGQLAVNYNMTLRTQFKSLTSLAKQAASIDLRIYSTKLDSFDGSKNN